MTKVGQIIAEEIEQAVSETWRQAEEKKQIEEKETARKLLKCGVSMDQILQCIDGMTREELEMMK